MVWNLRFSKELENLCDFKEQGIAVPALDEENVPNLRPDEDYTLDLFFILARSRPPSFGGWLAPIPLSEIAVCFRDYCAKGFMTRREFTRWMQILDQTVIEEFAPKEKPDSKEKKDIL